MPGEGQVREQGGEDKVGEAGVGTGSPSRLCLDSARQERKNQRAWKRGGWDLTLIIKLCLWSAAWLAMNIFFFFTPLAHFTSDKFYLKGGEGNVFNIHYLCSCSRAVCCGELTLVMIAFLGSLQWQKAFLYLHHANAIYSGLTHWRMIDWNLSLHLAFLKFIYFFDCTRS